MVVKQETFLKFLKEDCFSFFTVYKWYKKRKKGALCKSGYPQSNDQAERTNQEIETVFRCMTSQNPSSWGDQLPWAGGGGSLCRSIHQAMQAHLVPHLSKSTQDF